MRQMIQRWRVIATLALVLVTFTACSAPSSNPGSGYSPSSSAAPAAPSTKSDDASAAPTAAPAQNGGSSQPAQPALMAGMIDDNSGYADYLSYAANRQNVTYALPLDLSDRRFVKVTDGKGHPVADASVSLSDGSRLVFSGRTTSDGRVAFFPHTVDVAQTQSLSVNVSRDGASATGKLDLGHSNTDTTPVTLAGSSTISSLDIAFLLDSTGSMGDEIDRIKATIFTISQRISQLPGAPVVRLGLVTYRDHGDEYVTRHWDFTSDVSTFANNLNTIEAAAGGDTPEDFNAGLSDTLDQLSWNASQQHALRLVFLVTDAAPHTDYANEVQYDVLLKQAVSQGIKVFPIGASGLDADGEYAYRQVAAYTLAKFVFLTYENGSSGAPGTATNLSVGQYSTANLDDLIVGLVASEVANQKANFSGQKAGATTYPDSNPTKPQAAISRDIDAALQFSLIILGGIVAGGISVLLLLLGIMLVRWLRRPARKQGEPGIVLPAADETMRLGNPATNSLLPKPDYWASELLSTQIWYN